MSELYVMVFRCMFWDFVFWRMLKVLFNIFVCFVILINVLKKICIRLKIKIVYISKMVLEVF